jgi:plasmid replication initiation protein
MDDLLKPERHPQADLFICDLSDVILKDDMASMEHPFYSLSKKPDREPKRYDKGSNWIEFRPSIKGLPTIYDKDLIIYAISQVIAKSQEGGKPPKKIEIDPYSFLVFTNRTTGGRDYEALCDSLDRLDGTRFRTNVLFNGTRKDEWMGIIDGASLTRDERTGKLKKLTITLSDMMLDAIERRQVLTLHRDYFRLRKPIERRIYELARKHCGRQEEWRCSVEVLWKKSGSRSTARREFRRALRQIADHNYLPDYDLAFEAETDTVVFRNKGTMGGVVAAPQNTTIPPLDGDTYEAARKAAPGWDVRVLEREWRDWATETPRNPDAAFIGFCRKWFERRGRP